MNVLDYSIRLGKLLRKTKEGSQLLQMEAQIEEKYKDNDDFHQYEQYAERKSSRYYFFAWDMAYRSFLNVLTDASIEHRSFFAPTAELVSEDEEIKKFASTAVAFGNMFEKLTGVIISGSEYEKEIPDSWKYKVKNAISDVQIAVERTLLIKTMSVYYQRNKNVLDNAATQKYLTDREEKNLLPFSQEALDTMSKAEDVSEEEKLLYEKMFLIMEVVKKGIFYGFWGMVNEIREDELLSDDGLYGSPLQEITFSHQNNYSSFFGEGWLYKIQLEDTHVFFMAHKKQVQLSDDDGKSTISGIIYPSDDRGLFEKEEYK